MYIYTYILKLFRNEYFFQGRMLIFRKKCIFTSSLHTIAIMTYKRIRSDEKNSSHILLTYDHINII